MSAPETLLLTRRDVAGLMGPEDYLEAVEAGFRAAAEGKAETVPPLAIVGKGGSFHAKAASLRLDRHYVALKLNGNFPDNCGGLPTIQGAILLCDGDNGVLLAVIDSIEVTLRRTAAATALAARFLARPGSATLLVCGCGAQALAQIEALAAVLKLRRAFAWDRDPDRAQAFALRATQVAGVETIAVADLEQAGPASDVIVTCTTARSPFLGPAHVAPGTFVAAVGADSPEKGELQPPLMARATVVADSLDQCIAMGDLHHALEAGAIRRGDVHAELGAIVAGAAPGRTREDEIIVFDSTGIALQDVAAAAFLHRRASARPGLAAIALGS